MPLQHAFRPEKHQNLQKPPSRRLRRAVIVVAAIAAAGLAVAAALFISYWPFTRASIIRRLEREFSAKVDFTNFSSSWFPHPGCVAENVTFRRSAGNAPFIFIKRLTIQSSFAGLSSHPKHVEEIVAEGLRVRIAPNENAAPATGNNSSKPQPTVVDLLVADGAVVEVAPSPFHDPLVFQIHQARLRDVSREHGLSFRTALHIPEPPAEVAANGTLGAWDGGHDLGDVPLKISYALTHGDLRVIKGVAGGFAAQGEASGTLGNLVATGKTDSLDFEVIESGHRFHLATEFRALADAIHGNVVVQSLNAQFGKTSITGDGAVEGDAKTIRLNVNRGQGQIEDLIQLFSSAPRSPVTGPVRFQTRITVPPEKRKFKERVQLEGDFDIDPAHFTSGNTQGGVNKLSQRARGDKKDVDDPPPVLSDLKGHVVLRDGIANFSRLSFMVPGADATMGGTYSLVNKRIDLRGKLRMQATLSEATNGAKSFFLKVLDPFFKKKHAGAVVPVSMDGTYEHSSFHVGLTSKK